MDNSTYDVLNLSPTHSNETYSTLATIPIKNNQSYEVQRKTNTNKSEVREVNENDSLGAPSNTKFIVVLIIVMVILLLLTIISTALSIATYSRFNYEQSNVPSQLDNVNNDIVSVLDRFSTSVQSQLTKMLTQPSCGPGLWWRVAYLNMTDPSQQCPPAWREYRTNGVRACGRPVSSGGSCAAIFYFVGHQYRRVCGQIIGYQAGSPDAFAPNNEVGLDGIIITHGAQRHHVWSYVAGLREMGKFAQNCPCSGVNDQVSMPPPYIGDNYYCESGNPTTSNNQFFSDDPLWDGLDCEGTCCNAKGTNSPPWFSVQLPTPTTDIIEVSICCDQGTDNEDTPVELIEIYVQ